MSDYDHMNLIHDVSAKRLSVERALERSTGLYVNSRNVQQQPEPPLPPVQPDFVSNTQRYLPYTRNTLGYEPGQETVILPRGQANPAPLKNQVNLTSTHTYSNAFSGADLPPILFQIEPVRDDFSDIRVPTLCELETRQPVVTARGAILRYFSFLPRYISWSVPEALLEFWFRLDYRLEMNDILMRIESGPAVWDENDTDAARNALRMKRARFRENVLKFSNWGDSRRFPMERDVKFIGTLTPVQICLNTTMIVDVQNQRFLKPIFQEKFCKTHIGYIDAGLPFEHFLQSVLTTVPSKKMIAVMALRWALQDLAIHQNLGNMPERWLLLNKDDQPAWWHDKKPGVRIQVGKAIDILGNESWLDWMKKEFGQEAQAGVPVHMKTRGQQV